MLTEPAQDFYRNLPRLETPRLILRKAVQGDEKAIFAYASDPQVTRYLRWGPHRSLGETHSYLESVLGDYAAGRDGPWMVALKPAHTAVGHIHLMDLDFQQHNAEVGFVLSRAYWNQGIMTEALTKVFQYSFDILQLARVEAFCVCDNLAAARVLEKAGMVKEGNIQQFAQKGALWDFYLYVALR